MAKKHNHELNNLIQEKLFCIGVCVNDIANHISYDTEENCAMNNNGKWTDRLVNKFS